MTGCSGARFLEIATQHFNLMPQHVGALTVPTGDGHSQSKLEFLDLMVVLDDGRGRARRSHGLAQ